MAKEYNITEARSLLTKLPEELGSSETVRITRKGEPILAVLPWELYEAVLETLEVATDEETMAALRASAKDIAEGRTSSLEDFEEELEL
ncbi:MAG: type II toxin-antitoxin system Phd/YefM family antitoxin [Desulfovibrionaceae bacterium]